jgi:FkbM family methyltransferase
MTGTPSLVQRTRWKLSNVLWPERLRPNKVVTRWRQRACEAEATARWLAAGGEETGRPRPEARSQNGEDALLWDLVGDRERGFFIEAGAFDGYTFSVSYLFETAGWTGILVEPLADRAAEAAARRKGSRVVNAALSRPGTEPTAAFARDASVEWNSQLGKGGDLVDVTTVDAVLEGHTGAIDFAVLDVEGHEPAVLDGFDLARWRPRVLLVENNSGEGALRATLEHRGYAYVLSLAQNDLYLRRDELELAGRLEGLWDDLGPV